MRSVFQVIDWSVMSTTHFTIFTNIITITIIVTIIIIIIIICEL